MQETSRPSHYTPSHPHNAEANLSCLQRLQSLERLKLGCSPSCFMNLCSHLHVMPSLKELKFWRLYGLDGSSARLHTSWHQIAQSDIQVLSIGGLEAMTDAHVELL